MFLTTVKNMETNLVILQLKTKVSFNEPIPCLVFRDCFLFIISYGLFYSGYLLLTSGSRMNLVFICPFVFLLS